MSNRNSDTIANAVATPATFNNAGNVGGVVRHAGGNIAAGAADAQNSIQRGARVPSNAYIQSVTVAAADFTTAGAIDVGVYQTVENGGAVVDADLFASAFVMTNGPTSNVDVTHESGEYTTAERSQPLWQVLGLSSDPNREYDIAATITTQFNGGQAYRIDVYYTL